MLSFLVSCGRFLAGTSREGSAPGRLALRAGAGAILGLAAACGGGGGSSSSAPSTPAPTISTFSVSPGSIVAGQSATLSWTVSGATSLSIDHGVGDVTGKTSVTVTPAADTSYTLSATNSGGTSTRSVGLGVAAYNYTTAYSSGLQGHWIRSCWEASDGALSTNFAAPAPGGRSGSAIEVNFGPGNSWNAFGLASRESDWSQLYYLYLNEYKTIEFDIYLVPGTTGVDNLNLIIEDAGHSSQPKLTDLIPGWAGMNDAQRYGQWLHVSIDLSKQSIDVPRFEQFLFFNGADASASQPHFFMANVKLGWLDDAVPPVVSLGTAATNLTYDQLSLPFTTDKATTFEVDYGIGNYNTRFVGTDDFALSHSPVITGLTPGATYQYRVVALAHRNNSAAAPAPGNSTGSFPLPPKPTVPPVISGLSASGVESFKAILAWSTDRPCTETFTYQKSGGSALSRSLTDYQADRNFVLDLLEPSSAYTVTVQATDAFGLSSSKTLSFSTNTTATADVTISVDANSAKAISPYIYGTNQNLGAKQYTFGRMGGDLWTTYNWTINACNAGNDWYNWNYDYIPWSYGVPADQETKPGIALTYGLNTILGPAAGPATNSNGALITVPVQGNVAADNGTDPNDDVSKSGPDYLTTRFKTIQVLKGAPFTLTPSASDPHVYTDEYINWIKTVAKAAHPGKDIFYSLDNEPDIWFGTHKVSVPQQDSYDSFIAKETAAAKAIKGVDPAATVFGFVSYGWYGYTQFQGSPDGSGSDFNAHGDFTEYYLDQMKQAEQAAGKRLVDVLDLHYYTSAETPDGSEEVGSSDISPAVDAARVQSTRALWDPNFVETSWIKDTLPAGDQAIRLLPRMQAKIDAKYPGTKLAITEYNFRGGMDISGALAEADALGIFGQFGVFAATRWQMDDSEPFEEGAFKMFRGFDGASANFGDTSLMTSSSDTVSVAAYASTDTTAPGRVVFVAINRSTSFKDVALNGATLSGTAKVYRMTAASPDPVFVGSVPVNGTVMYLSLPPMTVSTIEVK